MNNILSIFSLLFIILNISKTLSIICYGVLMHAYINKDSFKNKETIIISIADIFFYEIFILSFTSKSFLNALKINKATKLAKDILFFVIQIMLVILINETKGVKVYKSEIILPYIISISISLIKLYKDGRSK